jgi:hypothetical protein
MICYHGITLPTCDRDTAYRSAQQKWHQTAPMLSLIMGTARRVLGQHRELIRDDQVVFFICPELIRHAARL